MHSLARRCFLYALGGSACCGAVRQLLAAPPPWQYEGTFGSLQVLADFVPRDVGCFDQLSRLRHDLRRALELQLPDTPVRILLFQDRARMRSYVRRKLPSAPDRRALFVHHSRSSTIYVSEGPSRQEDLRHELVHALLHNSIPSIPLWLDEGLAEYFEVAPADRARRQDYLQAIRAQLATGKPFPLAHLEQLQQVDQMQLFHYRQAWAWVHFLLHGCPPARDELVRFLGDLGRGIPAGQLERRVSQRVGRLEHRFREHFLSESQGPPGNS